MKFVDFFCIEIEEYKVFINISQIKVVVVEKQYQEMKEVLEQVIKECDEVVSEVVEQKDLVVKFEVIIFDYE